MGLTKTFRNLFGRDENPIDPSIFNHPLCLKTSWAPLRSGGSNFRTHHLVTDKRGRLVFRPYFLSYIFALLLISLTVYVSIGRILDLESAESDPWTWLVKCAVILVMLVFFIGLFRPRKFDFERGIYWRGYRPPGNKRSSKWAFIHDIGGIQMINERVRSNSSSYTSYELNLVLKNGERRNVVDHGNLEGLRDEAQQLARRLNVPLWDASAYQ